VRDQGQKGGAEKCARIGGIDGSDFHEVLEQIEEFLRGLHGLCATALREQPRLATNQKSAVKLVAERGCQRRWDC